MNFNTQFGMQQHGRLTEMTDKDEYVSIYNEAANNDNLSIEDELLKRPLISSDYAAGLPNVNQLEEIFRNALIHLPFPACFGYKIPEQG